MANLNLTGLTRGEVATITRKRLELTQREMADQSGIHRNTYSKIEKCTDTDNVDIDNMEPLSEQEICFIKRKRKGLTQQECADLLGVTRFWYNQMERGNESADMLTTFWS